MPYILKLVSAVRRLSKQHAPTRARSKQTLGLLILFGALAIGLACPTDGRSMFAGSLLRRFLEMAAQLHLAVDAFALQLLFQNAKSLVDVVVADDDLHET